ncbi:histidine kinase [Gemmobacter lutimaris]|uniref:Histidine kinase n=1 Tax=Gemmobacter lutimaris TaxID=2306023 RepID=A0A398C0F2_9RHOB|nr:DUF6446 family protein [Gemmobacter lutimaris]RID93710.1 histidine kinase [Gemmobacter lutimaris]
MSGKLIAGGIVLIAAIAGIAIYWLQIYAFYEPATFQPGAEIQLTPILGEAPEAILAENVEGIDATSSPLRFRACFHTPMSQAMLTETYRVYDQAEPLVGPPWFDCFNAEKIGEALETGEAIAFLSVHDIVPGVDRVVAVFPNGNAYAWHQLNDKLKEDPTKGILK